jgi:hypothetical protein
MNADEIRRCLVQLVSADPAERDAAREALYTQQEDAVYPLLDQFYAGVDEATGVAVLGVLADIGGPDALAALRQVFHFEERPAWRRAAARGLLRNRANLDHDEITAVERFLETNG